MALSDSGWGSDQRKVGQSCGVVGMGRAVQGSPSLPSIKLDVGSFSSFTAFFLETKETISTKDIQIRINVIEGS